MIDIREFFANLTKYRGQLKVDPRKVAAVTELGVKSDGTPHNQYDRYGLKMPGPAPRKYEDADSGGATSTLATPAGYLSEVLYMGASFLMGVGIANRTCELRIPDIGYPTCMGSSPNTHFPTAAVTLAATQYGGIFWFKGDKGIWTMTNGTAAYVDEIFPEEIWLYPGADFQAIITANGQSDENTMFNYVAREYPYTAVSGN
jgi:hypothetical protein